MTSPIKQAMSVEQATRLRELGVTEAQLSEIRSRLKTIRYYVIGPASKQDVLDPLVELHAHLCKAQELVKRMCDTKRPALVEARGHLASGATDFDASSVCEDIESSTEGTVPEYVDVPTLLRILVTAADHAVHAHAPKKQRRPTAPWRAVAQIVAALNRPKDHLSKASARRLTATRTAGSDFVALCSIVFDATGVNPRTARRSERGEPRGDVDRSVRRYIVEMDGRPQNKSS